MTNSVTAVDCLVGLKELTPGCAQVVYLDPPFNTGVKRSYNDAFGDTTSYLAYIRPRAALMHRALSPTGSMFFHCDWRASHAVKLMLDEVFAVAMGGTSSTYQSGGVFVNEIIWHYGLGAARAKRNLMSKHDVIFWYAKSPAYVFNQIRGAPTPAMVRKYCHLDEAGNRYLMSYGRRYILKGGKPLDDVWDIPSISPTGNERVGYQTQKPLALLSRIVALSSNVGDLIVDPFCGSGTTLVAAQALGRSWLGFDISPEAVAIAIRRTQQV